MEKLKQKQQILFRAIPKHPNTGIPRLLENSNILYIILQVWIPHGGAQGYPKLLLRCMPKHAKIGSPRFLQKETSFGVCLKVSELFKKNQNRFLKPSKPTRWQNSNIWRPWLKTKSTANLGSKKSVLAEHYQTYGFVYFSASRALDSLTRQPNMGKSCRFGQASGRFHRL